MLSIWKMHWTAPHNKLLSSPKCQYWEALIWEIVNLWTQACFWLCYKLIEVEAIYLSISFPFFKRHSMLDWMMVPPKIYQMSGMCACFPIWKKRGSLQMELKVLRWGDHPGLLKWALNPMRSVLKIDPQEKRTERRHTDRRGGGSVNPEAETGEIGVLRPQQDAQRRRWWEDEGKSCRDVATSQGIQRVLTAPQSLEARKVASLELQREHSLPTPWFQTSGL